MVTVSGPFFWNEFEKMRREFDAIFSPSLQRLSLRTDGAVVFPQVSVGETAEDVRVYIFVPGIDLKTLDLSIQGSLLKIETQRDETTETGDRCIVHRRERPQGSFKRLITLPDSVDPQQVHATYENGILCVLVGKKSQVKPKKIDISAN